MTDLRMTDDEFRLFRDFIHKECGLYFGSAKKSFLAARVSKRVANRSMKSFYRYYSYLQQKGAEHRAELMLLLDLLTINETGFFRNRPQFRLLEKVVLPEIMHAKAATGFPCLRMWSAGCATGEEPYSMAISVLETVPRRDGWRIEIFASDLSLSALEKASRGVYETRRLEAMDRDLVRRYFELCREGYAVREEVRNLVIYDYHNLKHDNGLRDLNVIFCRNVLIYFDSEAQKNVLSRFVRALQPGGYLFLGHSESLFGLTDELEFVHRDKGTAYRKVSKA